MKIDDLTLQDNLSKSLRGLNSLAKILKKRRIENGYVMLENHILHVHSVGCYKVCICITLCEVAHDKLEGVMHREVTNGCIVLLVVVLQFQ